jgi:hypothetical protein
MAGRRGTRIRKIARRRQELQKYGKLLNEPSHFSLRHRAVGSIRLRSFITLGRSLFDAMDKHLIVAILNDVLSRGRVSAILGPEPENTPGILRKCVVTAHDLERTPDGRLAFRSRSQDFVVVPADELPRGPWPLVPVVVQHSVGISIGMQLTTKRGRPIDLSNFETLLRSLGSTTRERAYLRGHLRKLGFEIQFSESRSGVPR